MTTRFLPARPSAAIAGLTACLCATVLHAAPVSLLTWDGPITPIAAEYLVDGIVEAPLIDAALIIVQLDTPGGLDSSMRDIIKAQLASEVPVVVWVGPSGSRAASAGAFMAVAAHVTAMAPGTNIGSASPVSMGGAAMDSTMAKKVANDAAAYIASIAERRGRNPDVARSFVTEAINLTADEAREQGIIDFLAPTLSALLDSLRGRTIMADDDTVTVPDEVLEAVAKDLGARQKFLKTIADPNVAYILMMLGIYGLFFELSNPGAFAPGVLGAICLLLALFAFQALPVDSSGAALILLGVVLLLLEVKVVSHGVLSLGGVASLVLGSLMLFDSPEPWAQVSLHVLVPTVVIFAGFFLLCVVLAVRARRRPVVTGKGAMVGEVGRVVRPVGGGEDPGKVAVHGEIWNAVAAVPLAEGTSVKVCEVTGRTLRVEPVENEPEPR